MLTRGRTGPYPAQSSVCLTYSQDLKSNVQNLSQSLDPGEWGWEGRQQEWVTEETEVQEGERGRWDAGWGGEQARMRVRIEDRG